MARLILSHIDGAVQLLLRDHYLGRVSYKHLTEVEPELALELGSCGAVFWEDSVMGRPIRPVVLFKSHEEKPGRVHAEVYECFSAGDPPALTFEMSEREALSVVQRNEVYIISWEGRAPTQAALLSERLAA